VFILPEISGFPGLQSFTEVLRRQLLNAYNEDNFRFLFSIGTELSSVLGKMD